MKKAFVVLMAVLCVLAVVGCGGGEAAVKMDLKAVYGQMESTLPTMTAVDAGLMLNMFGLQAEDCAEAVLYVSADGLRADEVWLIEAKNADALANIKAKAERRLESKGEETVTYAPEQYEVVQDAKTITVGNYLALLVSPDVDKLAEIFNKAAGK